MNTNFFRTIMGGLTGSGMLVLLVKLAGCSIDDPATVAIEATTCAGSTFLASLSPFAVAIGTGVVFLIGALAKLAKSGTVAENLIAPSVPVVPAAANRIGVVSQKDVDSPK